MIQIRFTKIPIQFRHFPRDPERKKQTIAIFASLWLASCCTLDKYCIQYIVYLMFIHSQLPHEADFDRKRVSNSGNLLMNRTVLSSNALAFGSLNVVWFLRIWEYDILCFVWRRWFLLLPYNFRCSKRKWYTRNQIYPCDIIACIGLHAKIYCTCDHLWPL